MKGDPIPDDHHVARHCGGSKVDEEGMPRATAFMLRDGEPDVSVNWLEYFRIPEREKQIEEVRRVFALKEITVGEKSRFAVLPVGATIGHVMKCTDGKRLISFIHDPEGPPEFEYDDPSHSGIYGVPPEDKNVVAKYISESAIESFPGRLP